MEQPGVTFTVRPINATTAIIGVLGDLNIFAESALMDAYERATTPTTRTVIMDFTGLDYMNSGGIGLLVTLLIRMQRQNQRLFAFGLSEHYTRIFEMNRLDEPIKLFDSEAEALVAASDA